MITYQELIEGINSGEIEECTFSIKGYNHYRDCVLRRVYIVFGDAKSHDCIELCLTKDRSEISRYYGPFKDNHRVFNIKGKGRFNLKEVWKQVEITNIVYKK